MSWRAYDSRNVGMLLESLLAEDIDTGRVRLLDSQVLLGAASMHALGAEINALANGSDTPKILIPISFPPRQGHIKTHHMAALMFEPTERRVTYQDSRATPMPDELRKAIDSHIEIIDHQISQQKNSGDCAAHMIHNLVAMAHGEEIEASLDIDSIRQQHSYMLKAREAGGLSLFR